jgi:hypothetical protein
VRQAERFAGTHAPAADFSSLCLIQAGRKILFFLDFPVWHGICKASGSRGLGERRRTAGCTSGGCIPSKRGSNMQNALLVGLSRQVALSRELDVVANNIANLNTNGFKADGALFEEYLSTSARAGGASAAATRVSFVRARGTWHDMT